MTAGLLALLKEKELRDITIDELAARSEVSRISIYRNYEDKESIIQSYIGTLLREWKVNTEDSRKMGDSGLDDVALCSLFDTLKAHKEVFLLLTERKLLYLLRSVLKELFGPTSDQANFDAYYSSFIYNGIYGWIEEWIARGMTESASEMVVLLRNASTPKQ